MKVAVTGATGNIGRALVRELTGQGDEVTALSRNAVRARETLGIEAVGWERPKSGRPPAEALRGRDGVVNLLGEPLAQRWTEEAKREIRDSRILGTRNLVAALAELPEGERPRVLVSQSAVGWYGARADEPVDESEPAGSGFEAQSTVDWEAEARRAEELGVRVVTTRTGVYLSQTGGALETMLPPFRLGVGGPVAGGRQYVPWVHLDDVVGALAFCLHTEAATGPVNVTAPEPVTNREFSKALGRVLRRPAVVPVPGLAVKVLYGEMAVVVTTGRRAVPRRLQELGYEFRRPDLEAALRDATGKR
ncbi:MAG TPA: TIGR01777 family oxidoreductase [Thermoleophilaceae bacterium]